jgi:hypothetical protein
MLGTIEIEQTKRQATYMNRAKLTSTVSRNAFGVNRNERSFDWFVGRLETRYPRTLEEYFAPSRPPIAVSVRRSGSACSRRTPIPKPIGGVNEPRS